MAIAAETACATLTIDLTALADNWRKLSLLAAPAECAAAVKADAYGLGLAEAAPALARAGCRTFFVAHVGEGGQLRAILGEDVPGCRIYVLNGLPPGDPDGESLTRQGLRPVLASLDDIRRWRICSERNGAGLPAALQIDTGMNRLGLPPDEVAEARVLIGEAPRIALDFVMSHFVSSERPNDPLNRRQTAEFRNIIRSFPGVAASLANSSGIFLPQRPHFGLVRPGFALYGGNPTPGEDNPMRPVVRLQAPILQVRAVPEGAGAGYNSLWTARRDSRLATIGIGYADGFPRGAGAVDGRAAPGAEAIVAGRRCPFVGRTSMDLSILDVTDLPEGAACPGVLAEILGAGIGVDELAARSGTIGYEILTSLGPRFHRTYKRA